MRSIIKLLLILLLAGLTTAEAQNTRDDNRDAGLAKHYVEQGYYEQAAFLYERLFGYKGNERLFYQDYFTTLLSLKDYETLQKVVRKMWKLDGENPVYLADLLETYTKAGNPKATEKTLNEIVMSLPANRYVIEAVANRLFTYSMTDAADLVFKKGNQLLKDPLAFAPQQAYVAQLRNDKAMAMTIYVDWAANKPEYQSEAQNGLQRLLKEPADFDELEKMLLKRLQADKQHIIFPELLLWLYLQRNDFEGALLQAKSLDALNNEDGSRILHIAQVAATNKDYETTIRAYKYIINKGPQNPYYVSSTLELINTQRDKITKTTNYTDTDLQDLRSSYLRFLGEYRDNRVSVQASRELARLEAFYLHRPDSAIAILENVIEDSYIDLRTRSEAKLELGDYYLMAGEVWEPVLLYTQVDKDFKGAPLGEEAKYRNAKLSYYKGDFEWSQAQLRIIKTSTSELISNDAIDLSVFIIDNTTIDTNPEPMALFAGADLLQYQNKSGEALEALNELERQFPSHRLEDDVDYLRAKIYFNNKAFSTSAEWLEKLLQLFEDGILGDNALFMLGEMYENQLNDPDKAMKYYEKIITDHNASVFVVEARKRFRKLRGDSVN